MKHIMIATDAWHPQINGVVRTLERLAAELKHFGIAVDFLTPDAFRTLPLPGYPEIRLAMAGKGAIRKRLEEMLPDHVHIATEGPIGFATRAACRATGRAFTTSYHTRFPEYVAARLPIPESVTYSLLRRFHNSGSATLVATPSLAGELRRHGFTKLAPWTRGVDLDRFAPSRRVDIDLPRPIFIYVGRLAVEKSIDEFLKLDLPGSKLVVGDGPQREELESRFPSAHFAGVAEGLALAGLYAAADVMVFPSRTDTFGLVVLEALASGTPVAAYPVTGPKDVLEGSGAGVVNEDLRVAALEALKIDPARCVAHARSYTWRRSAEMFMDAIAAANPAIAPEAKIVGQAIAAS
ncbi:MAG: glycosyltransferase family 1 protein [Rhodobiaceae bacterium]|nr:glycosyltransferase family 1 protein [Rhodobiaceae bacterium]MCC0055740.1 glycosyltransferase family 1 protein [Rhodobiaceae bacterium]